MNFGTVCQKSCETHCKQSVIVQQIYILWHWDVMLEHQKGFNLVFFQLYKKEIHKKSALKMHNNAMLLFSYAFSLLQVHN